MATHPSRTTGPMLPAQPDPYVAVRQRLAQDLGPRRLGGLLLLVGILLVGIGIGPTLRETGSIWDLDAEHSPFAALSGIELLVAGLAGVVGSRTVIVSRSARWTFVAFGAFLAFMATDEWLVIHERIEFRLGVDWQIIYLPVILAGGVAWALVLRFMRDRAPAAIQYHVAGAAAWFVSQFLEFIQHDAAGDKIPGLVWTVVPEEALEFLGSVLFGLAMLVIVRRPKGGLPPVDPAEDAPTPPD